MPQTETMTPVLVPIEDGALEGDLVCPPGATGVVLFAHGSGSSRFSSRNRAVAGVLQRAGFATLLFDLLTQEEEERDRLTGELRFDVAWLARRLIRASIWARQAPLVKTLPFGYFGASTGAAAALMAAAQQPEMVAAVVSRGGRPDLAGGSLARVRAPTLLIVGGRDTQVIELNEQAYARLKGVKAIEIVPDATHLFEEPGALEAVAELARGWFQRYLHEAPAARRPGGVA